MKVLVIGSGHVGGAAIDALRARDHEVIAASRTGEPSVDAGDPASITALFEHVGQVDAVIAALGSAPFKPLAELTHDDFVSGLLRKAMAQIDIVQIGTPHVSDGGSFSLTAGVLSREPLRTAAASAVANGALDAFTMAAAAELPRGIRINCISPTVLVEAPAYHPAFPGWTQVSAAAVGQAFVKAVEGVATGTVVALDGQ